MVVPKVVREHLGLQPGDQMDFVIQDDGQVIVRPAAVDVRTLRGILAKPGRKPVSVAQMNAAIRRRAGGRA
jgi:AbrB family looped-hinge helix DNA binding protein